MAAHPESLALAPITITPTKPLTPTHVKGLLWLDVIRKTTSELVETAYVWNSRTPNVSAQTLVFWEYLDRTRGDVDWGDASEDELGDLYVQCHAQAEPPGVDALRPYVERVESEGWMHLASRRLLELWQAQLELLGVEDPGIAMDRAPGVSAEEALELLAERGLLVDHRHFGGPAYVDGAIWGLPLRQLVGEDGHANYVLAVLRDLIPLIGDHDRFLLAFDEGLAEDYVLVDRVLRHFGARVSRLALGRVPIDGTIRSSRLGGWKGHTLAALSRLCLQHFDLPAYRLGMRIYFIAILKRSSPQSFRADLLRRSLLRAQRIVGEPGASGGDDDYISFLRERLADGGYVDPHRLTTALLERHGRTPTGRLVRSMLS
jgi:hypothetical protein